MATILENIQKARFLPTRPLRDDLPTFQGVGPKEESHLMGLRKRLSSFSGKIQPISSASAEWAFRRSQSAPSLAAAFGAGGPIKRWWDWGVGWLLSKKLGFADDLEMNEEEVAALGRQSRGTRPLQDALRRPALRRVLPLAAHHAALQQLAADVNCGRAQGAVQAGRAAVRLHTEELPVRASNGALRIEHLFFGGM